MGAHVKYLVFFQKDSIQTTKISKLEVWSRVVELYNSYIIIIQFESYNQFNSVRGGPVRSVAVRCGLFRSVAVRCCPLRSGAVCCCPLRSVPDRCSPVRSVAVRCGPESNPMFIFSSSYISIPIQFNYLINLLFNSVIFNSTIQFNYSIQLFNYFLFSPETPLTLATSLKNPRDVMMTLLEGGAHLDYRDRNGMTPMHRAALAGNKMAIQVGQGFVEQSHLAFNPPPIIKHGCPTCHSPLCYI